MRRDVIERDSVVNSRHGWHISRNVPVEKVDSAAPLFLTPLLATPLTKRREGAIPDLAGLNPKR
jgi:hypothetical protein